MVNILSECLHILIDCSQLSKTYCNVLFGCTAEKITRKASDVAENVQLWRVVRFFHPRLSCTMHISADVQRITLNASCMTISVGRTEQLDIFCHVTGFTSNFLSFIVVELFGSFTEPFNCSASQILPSHHSLCCYVCVLLSEVMPSKWMIAAQHTIHTLLSLASTGAYECIGTPRLTIDAKKLAYTFSSPTFLTFSKEYGICAQMRPMHEECSSPRPSEM